MFISSKDKGNSEIITGLNVVISFWATEETYTYKTITPPIKATARTEIGHKSEQEVRSDKHNNIAIVVKPTDMSIGDVDIHMKRIEIFNSLSKLSYPL